MYGYSRAVPVRFDQPSLKVPAEAQAGMREAYWAIFDTDELLAAGMQPGPELVAAVHKRLDAVAEKYASAFPSAIKCLLTDREQLTSYLRFPLEHHRRIRHSNLIERTFGETRRRVKVIGRLPGEASCLNPVWAVLDRASRGWRGMAMSTGGTRLLADLRRQLLDPPIPIRRPKIDTDTTHTETVGAVAQHPDQGTGAVVIYTAQGTQPSALRHATNEQHDRDGGYREPEISCRAVAFHAPACRFVVGLTYPHANRSVLLVAGTTLPTVALHVTCAGG